MTAGVYYILNQRSGHLYIGSSAKVEYRLGQHRSLLRGGKHRSKRLQAAWSKDGPDAFVFSLLTEVRPLVGYSLRELLEAHEGFWMKYYRSDHPRFGYNDRRLGKSWIAQVFDWSRAYFHKRWDAIFVEESYVYWAQRKAQEYYVELPPYRREP